MSPSTDWTILSKSFSSTGHSGLICVRMPFDILPELLVDVDQFLDERVVPRDLTQAGHDNSVTPARYHTVEELLNDRLLDVTLPRNDGHL
jgi:hypothetical protein